MARKETEKKEDLRDFSELSDDIYKVLKKNNINGKNIKEFLSEVARSLNRELDIDIESGAHFAIPLYVKKMRDKMGNKLGSTIVLPSGYGNSITGASYYVVSVNLTPLEIEKVLKLKAFM